MQQCATRIGRRHSDTGGAACCRLHDKTLHALNAASEVFKVEQESVHKRCPLGDGRRGVVGAVDGGLEIRVNLLHDILELLQLRLCLRRSFGHIPYTNTKQSELDQQTQCMIKTRQKHSDMH